MSTVCEPPPLSKAIAKPRGPRAAGQTSRRRAFTDLAKRGATDEHGRISVANVAMPVRPPAYTEVEEKRLLADPAGEMRISKAFLDALAIGTEVHRSRRARTDAPRRSQ